MAGEMRAFAGTRAITKHSVKLDTKKSDATLLLELREQVKKTTGMSEGGVVKFGTCLEDQSNIRPFSSEQHDTEFFRDDNVIVVIHGIEEELYAFVERNAIKHSKHVLKRSINVRENEEKTPEKNKPTTHRKGCLYMVSAHDFLTTQEKFKAVHRSDYKKKQAGEPAKPRKLYVETKPRKRYVRKAETKPRKTRSDKGKSHNKSQ